MGPIKAERLLNRILQRECIAVCRLV